jgi:hypothetical protein
MVGKTLTLVEDFSYSDGTIEQRVWTLEKIGDDDWVGTADGVIGGARGEESGDMLLSDDRMLNKAYMSKFGVPLGEVTIIFEKR